MACNNYNSNSALPLTMVAGNLPPGFVHENWQTTLETFIQHTIATLPGSYSTFIVSSTTPNANDQDKLWLKVGEDCRPMGLYLYYNAEWIRVGVNVFYGEDSSTTVNVLTVTQTDPEVNTLLEGQKFLVKAANTNTGTCVITINGSMAVGIPIKKNGGEALAGYEFLAGGILELVYDGTDFQLTNPRIDVSIPRFGFENNGFEIDNDSDGIPDYWDRTVTGSATGEIDTSDTNEGARCFKITLPGGTGNGYCKLTSSFIEVTPSTYYHLSWWFKSTVAAVPQFVTIEWFDANQASLSTSTVYSEATNNPANIWTKLAGLATSPSGAKFCKVSLQSGDSTTNYATATCRWDDFRLERPHCERKVIYSVPGSHSWKCPTGIYQVRVTCSGAGGGGGGAKAESGGGGGGGGTAQSYVVVVPGTTYAVVVGSGGDGGDWNLTPATAGGNSSFNSTTVVGNGGGAGASNTTSAAGGAGGGGTGTVVISGATGGSGTAPAGGIGGDSYSGGYGGKQGTGSHASPGGSPGGGGGGATDTASADLSGGDGGDGQVMIEYL